MIKSKKPGVIIAVVAAASMFFVACSSDSDSSPSPTTQAAEQSVTIVSVAAGNPDFSTLVSAVTTAGLVETLSGPGPYTVFAPTDEAFAALPEGTLDSLTPEQLSSILTYHVIEGEVLAADVTAGPVKTVNGEELTINVDGSAVTLTDAQGNTVNVTSTDITTDNGVIHVIDGVLMP